MNSSEIVDFNKSNFSWLGDSKGKFKIASIISITKETTIKNRYILTENVLAGNVYSKNNLIKTPSYLFQVIASKKYQKIFRTDLDSKFFDLSPKNLFRRNILDSEGNIFGDNLNFNIKYKCSYYNRSFEDLNKNFSSFDFNSRISFKKNGGTFFIEFPIKHLNLNEQNKEWQVETGPIIFPILNNDTYSLIPSFIFFNSFKKIDVFLDYPLKKRKLKKFKNNIIKDFECKIEMFSD